MTVKTIGFYTKLVFVACNTVICKGTLSNAALQRYTQTVAFDMHYVCHDKSLKIITYLKEHPASLVQMRINSKVPGKACTF